MAAAPTQPARHRAAIVVVVWTALGLAGLVLACVSPLLLLLGAWGGADSGGVAYGLLMVLGVPCLILGVCSLVAIGLLRTRFSYAACIPALAPLAVELWLYLQMAR